MKIHRQKSDKATHVFWDLDVTENQNGSISIPSGKFYLQGQEYELTKVENEPFPVKSRLFIEKSDVGADYYLDTTGHGTPVSFGTGIGAVLVVWYEEEIHCLRSIEK
jgi:hypothetical protein